MRVADVMSKAVETIGPADAAETAWDLMRQRRIRHLVVMQGRDVVGVLSERDLGGRNGASVRDQRSVGDLMSRSAVTAKPTDTLRQAANRLRTGTIGCLPVTEGRRLVGLLTVSDVLEMVGRGAERPVGRSKRWTLKHRGPKRK